MTCSYIGWVLTFSLWTTYYSSYVKIAKLNIVASLDVINHLKSIFARHGIPETVVLDNGSQYAAQEFVKFAENQGFAYVTISPRYTQSNGKAEQAAQTVTNLLKKSVDPYNALLSYHSTPPEYGYCNYRYFSVFLISRIPTISQFVELYIRVWSLPKIVFMCRLYRSMNTEI